MKDNALVQQLKHMGHDAVMLPMYLPHILDEEPADEDQPIFFGGINAYLQLKYSFFRHVPKWLDKVLDSRPLLGKVAKAQKGNMTAGREISEMALSTFQGEKGPLAKEFRHLVQWAVERENPDAIYLSTAMQVGLAPAIKQRRDIPVFCSLQGEDAFLESLIEPYKTQIWELMREASVAVEKYISPSKAFADCMAKPLRLNKDRIAIIPNGINLDGYEPRTSPPDRPAIGYLARMSNLKGLDILVDAFIHLHQLGNLPIDTELRIAGTTLPDDQSYIDEQIRKLDEAGLQGRYTFRQNITRDEKIEHLRNLTVLSVPTRYGEAFGLYAAEAMAAGIPVVQPDHGAFPEIMAATGGGAIFFPNTPEALADALLPWINDPAKAHATGKKAHAAVKEHYSIQRHAEQMLQCLPVHA
jgi:glycosyltransferase involved in cell wall biosynthesis